jgi:hypothetical protein
MATPVPIVYLEISHKNHPKALLKVLLEEVLMMLALTITTT